MKYSNLKEEKKLWQKGCQFVAGIDEVGRGPLAGPVIAVAVVLNPKHEIQLQNLKLKDSKKLSQKQREQLYPILTTHPAIWWGEGRVSAKVIDRINILQATKLAMQRALWNLEKKLSQKFNHLVVDFVILDGNMKLPLPLAQKSVVKGDEKVFSCAAASIIAKVRRDRLMVRYHKRYPQYGFRKHKGYGTRRHFLALKEHGICPLHRKSFL